jgi:hypothetical protein
MIYARYGEVWELKDLPESLKKSVRKHFFVRPSHRYVFMVIGIDTSGDRKIINACSYPDRKSYMFVIRDGKLPMIVEHPKNRVYGKLAPRHGLFKIQELPRHLSWTYSPHESWWEDTTHAMSYEQCRRTFMRLRNFEIRKRPQHRKPMRMVLIGPLGRKDAAYKVFMGSGADYFKTKDPYHVRIGTREEVKLKNAKYFNEKLESRKRHSK